MQSDLESLANYVLRKREMNYELVIGGSVVRQYETFYQAYGEMVQRAIAMAEELASTPKDVLALFRHDHSIRVDNVEFAIRSVIKGD